MQRRSIKSPSLGSQLKGELRRHVRAVHVVPRKGGIWEVRTLGPKRIRKSFDSKTAAMKYANSTIVGKGRDIIKHAKRRKKV